MKQINRLLILLPLAMLLGCAGSSLIGEVTVADLHQSLAANPALVLVDVRTPEEWRAERAVGIKSFVEYDQIAARHGEIGADFETPIYLICRSGHRSGIAAKTLHDQGYKHVYNVAGGTSAWVAEDYPVTSGPLTD